MKQSSFTPLRLSGLLGMELNMVNFELWRMAYQDPEDAAKSAFELAAQRYREKELFRALLEEWEGGIYDSQDFLRRVRLALHENSGLKVVPNS